MTRTLISVVFIASLFGAASATRCMGCPAARVDIHTCLLNRLPLLQAQHGTLYP